MCLYGRPIGYLAIGRHQGQFLQDNVNALKKSGASYEMLDTDQFKRKYAMLTYPSDYGGVYDQDGGLLRADRILNILQVHS